MHILDKYPADYPTSVQVRLTTIVSPDETCKRLLTQSLGINLYLLITICVNSKYNPFHLHVLHIHHLTVLPMTKRLSQAHESVPQMNHNHSTLHISPLLSLIQNMPRILYTLFYMLSVTPIQNLDLSCCHARLWHP